jgi:hypothetical protein
MSLRSELPDHLEATKPESVRTENEQLVLAFERRKLAGIENAEALWMPR